MAAIPSPPQAFVVESPSKIPVALYIGPVKKRRLFIALVMITLASVGGWQYALTHDYPKGTGEIIGAPDGKTYAAIVYLKKRAWFSEPREYVAMEIGRGAYHQKPEIIHYNQRPLETLDAEELSRMQRNQLVTWAPDSSEVTFHLGHESIKITIPETPGKP